MATTASTIPAVTDPGRFDVDAVFDPAVYFRFYRPLLNDERSDREVAALTRWLGLTTPVRILDLPCGHGRHANRLAALGHQVTGIDRSTGFLEVARADAAARGVSVDYRQGDMRDLELVSAFDVVLNLYTAFGYFTDDENLATLRAMSRALVPGGRLVIDVQNRDALLRRFKDQGVSEVGNDLMIDRARFDIATGRVVTHRTCWIDGVRHDARYFVRLYNLQEMSALCAAAGLAVTTAYGDWAGTALGLDSYRLIVIARKETP